MIKAVAIILVLTFSIQATAEIKEGDSIEKVRQEYKEMEKVGPQHEKALALLKDFEISAKRAYEKTKTDGSDKAEQEEARKQYLSAQESYRNGKVIYQQYKDAMKSMRKIIKDVESNVRVWSPEEAVAVMLKNGVTQDELAASSQRTPEGDAARAKMRRIAKKEGLKVTFDAE